MSNLIIVKFNDPKEDVTVQIFTKIQLFYGFPSLILMVFFLLYLGFSKNYVNSFYRLVQLDLSVNILCYINTWIAVRLEVEPSGLQLLEYLELSFPGFLTTSKFFATWFVHMQVFSICMLCIHRLTSIISTKNLNNFWSKYYFFIFLIGCIYSTLCMTPCLINGQLVNVVNPNGTIYKIYDVDQIDFSRIESAIVFTVYFLIIMMLGACTVATLSKQLQKMNVVDRGITKRVSGNAITNCFLFSGYLFYNIIMGLEPFLNFLPTPYTPLHNVIMTSASDKNVEADFVLVVDSSNAFSQASFEQVRSFLYKFVSSLTISPIDSQVALYAYGTSAQSVINLSDGSKIGQLQNAVNSTLKYQGSSEKNLFQALAKVSAEVTTNSGLRNADYKKMLVIISGDSWTGNQVIGSSILTQLQTTFNILSVGIGAKAITNQNSQLVQLPGVIGNTFFATTLDQLNFVSAWIATSSCSNSPLSTIAPPSTPLPSQSPSVNCPLTTLNYDVYLVLDVSNKASAQDFSAMKSAVADFIAPFPVGDGKTQFVLITCGMDSELYYTAFHNGQSRSDILNVVNTLLQDTTSGQALNTALYAAQNYLSRNFSTSNKILVYFTSTTAWDVSPIFTMQSLKKQYQVSPLAVQWGASASSSDLSNFAGSNCVNALSNKANTAVWLQSKMCAKVFC